jgi:hypothetical protein
MGFLSHREGGVRLKGQCHEKNIVFEGLNIYISVYALMVFKVFSNLTMNCQLQAVSVVQDSNCGAGQLL